MEHIDLFSGIGGFALAAKWTGFKTVVFCEKDEFGQKALKKHWPGIPIISEIQDFDGTTWRGTTLLTGGFPCQDISIARTQGQQGLDGNRSGLWFEMLRVIGEIRPNFIVVENVPNLLNRGFGRLLGGLVEIGYDSEWHCISASHVGAPHKRDRVWVVAYPRGQLGINQFIFTKDSIKTNAWDSGKKKWGIHRQIPEMGTETVPRLVVEQPERYCDPKLLRISNGIPNQLDRLKSLGNAIVPQVATEIMSRIKEFT